MSDRYHPERTKSMERIINWYRLESAAYFNNACYKQGNSMTRMAAVFTLLSCMASASALAASDCPFPQGVQASIGASKEAIAARQAGVAKDDLLTRISPTANGQMSKMLKSIVDEVYDYPALLPEVYAAFRFEHCFVSQQHAEQVAAMKFADAYPLLKKCEQLDPEGARPPCAMRVVHTLTGIPE
ncbi:hypothetical protein [Pseudomonas sp. RC2C2]|uniref:hypothetical protein n=1 Tax=Pseudomonas sp. RC2C2 TaxID=2834408 RepID=UPI001BCA7E60|nr:hypothetical protein [Pseudomonas sp. RC2C2]MBS7596722.1 hypothetical protein [Pseudomonas sp. RC2C2]